MLARASNRLNTCLSMRKRASSDAPHVQDLRMRSNATSVIEVAMDTRSINSGDFISLSHSGSSTQRVSISFFFLLLTLCVRVLAPKLYEPRFASNQMDSFHAGNLLIPVPVVSQPRPMWAREALDEERWARWLGGITWSSVSTRIIH